MSEPAHRRATYQDVLNAPPDVVAEILDGELYTSPRPGIPHSNAGGALFADVFGPFRRRTGDPGGPGGWWILPEPELHLGEDILVPDIAGWRRERIPKLPHGAFLTTAPDWVCEVLSPSTERIDRVKKMQLYGREGVQHLWLVNPETRTLEVYRRGGDFWQRVGAWAGDERVRAEPFEAVELDMARWWEDE